MPDVPGLPDNPGLPDVPENLVLPKEIFTAAVVADFSVAGWSPDDWRALAVDGMPACLLLQCWGDSGILSYRSNQDNQR